MLHPKNLVKFIIFATFATLKRIIQYSFNLNARVPVHELTLQFLVQNFKKRNSKLNCIIKFIFLILLINVPSSELIH